jgi:hypothetical protein
MSNRCRRLLTLGHLQGFGKDSAFSHVFAECRNNFALLSLIKAEDRHLRKPGG